MVSTNNNLPPARGVIAATTEPPRAPATPVIEALRFGGGVHQCSLCERQRRERLELLSMLICETREQILLALAQPGTVRLHVAEIARRAGVCAKKISAHLRDLRTAGLVCDYRSAQYREYELAPDRVRYRRRGHRLILTLFTRDGEPAVKITAKIVEPKEKKGEGQSTNDESAKSE